MAETDYCSFFDSPIGKILISADRQGITGLWFENQKYYAAGLPQSAVLAETETIIEAKQWLDGYFSGKRPDSIPALHFNGTDFQVQVWKLLTEIPYGETVTYGDIASRLAKIRGRKNESARAVGNAIGHNKISVFVPCHRVLGSNGAITGYAGGVERKQFLLALEKRIKEQ